MAEWNASGYQSVSRLQEAIATEQLSRLTLGEHDRILDLGCGNGKITAAIAQRVPLGSVLGVDASNNMIAFAQWTRFLPEREWDAFITEVLDRYEALAADSPSENNTFKFYQMEVVLVPL